MKTIETALSVAWKKKTQTLFKHRLGKGKYNSVFERKNKNRVVSVGNDPSKMSYARWCVDQRKMNKLTKKELLHVPAYMIIPNKKTVLTMEKLKPLNSKQNKKENRKNFNRYKKALRKNPNTSWDDFDVGTIVIHPFVFYAYANNKNSKYEDIKALKKEMEASKKGQFHTFMSVVEKIYNKFKQLDLHQDNIMKREDGTWVITDPLLPAGNGDFSYVAMKQQAIYNEYNAYFNDVPLLKDMRSFTEWKEKTSDAIGEYEFKDLWRRAKIDQW
jgi:hypothetical protein